MDAGIYYKAIGKKVNKFYKKAPNNWEYNINGEAKEIAIELKIDDRIHKFHKQQVFITVKDHKANFLKPSILINQPNQK